MEINVTPIQTQAILAAAPNTADTQDVLIDGILSADISDKLNQIADGIKDIKDKDSIGDGRI